MLLEFIGIMVLHQSFFSPSYVTTGLLSQNEEHHFLPCIHLFFLKCSFTNPVAYQDCLFLVTLLYTFLILPHISCNRIFMWEHKCRVDMLWPLVFKSFVKSGARPFGFPSFTSFRYFASFTSVSAYCASKYVRDFNGKREKKCTNRPSSFSSYYRVWSLNRLESTLKKMAQK